MGAGVCGLSGYVAKEGADVLRGREGDADGSDVVAGSHDCVGGGERGDVATRSYAAEDDVGGL